MNKHRLGLSTIELSRIGIGSGGNLPKLFADDSKAAKKLLDVAWERGINWIDSAEAYDDGKSENFVGRYLSHSKKRYFVATKISAESVAGKNIRAAVEGSLRRLKIDSIPLYQIHWPVVGTSWRYVADELLQLRDEGKVQWLGVSNLVEREIQQAHQLFGEVMVSHQLEYNVGNRFAELGLVKANKKYGMSSIFYSPIPRPFRGDNNLHEHPIIDVARQRGVSAAQVCLAWTLRAEGTMAISGTTCVEHLAENIDASEMVLKESEIRDINEICMGFFAKVPVREIQFTRDWNKLFHNLEQAITSSNTTCPSINALSKYFKQTGECLPIKLKSHQGNKLLTGGEARYWAWLAAFGEQSSIPAVIEPEIC